jgi:hypothetical protein
VAASHALNARIEDDFLRQVAIRRAGRAVPEPIITPRYQKTLHVLAGKLQDGTISARKAHEASEEWGRRVYHGDVGAWVLDCEPGRDLWIPPDLLSAPTAVISCAVARFRPRSISTEQCAIIIVSATAAQEVGSSVLKPL